MQPFKDRSASECQKVRLHDSRSTKSFKDGLDHGWSKHAFNPLALHNGEGFPRIELISDQLFFLVHSFRLVKESEGTVKFQRSFFNLKSVPFKPPEGAKRVRLSPKNSWPKTQHFETVPKRLCNCRVCSRKTAEYPQHQKDCLFVLPALKIHISESSHELLSSLGGFQTERRGLVQVKVRKNEGDKETKFDNHRGRVDVGTGSCQV